MPRRFGEQSCLRVGFRTAKANWLSLCESTRICATILMMAAICAAEEPLKFDFETSRVSELPSGWQEAKTGEGEGSVWRVVSHEADGKSGRCLAQTSSAGANNFFNLCVRPEVQFADVEVRVRLLAKTGEHDRGGGVVWRYRDANNYYITRWNPLEDNFRVYHVVNGKRTQLANADVKLAADQWHTVRAVHRGNHIQCYLDDQPLLDVHDETLKEAGAVGLWSKADAVTWFDDFSIQTPVRE